MASHDHFTNLSDLKDAIRDYDDAKKAKVPERSHLCPCVSSVSVRVL